MPFPVGTVAADENSHYSTRRPELGKWTSMLLRCKQNVYERRAIKNVDKRTPV